MTILARIENVSVREAWAHEATRFTPWLAENLDSLSEAIGVELELTKREMEVGRYSADIFAYDPKEGRKVLIENQLEASDHTHLGQLLTYLAGLEAKVIVWVAPDFREEHLSALRWLNQHTAEEFAFFAVRVRVVRIAGSPLAPLFEVLEKPNNWDRNVHRQASEAAPLSERAQRLRAFWTRYAELYPAIADDPGAGGGVSRWRMLATGDDAIVISRYVSAKHVGLFLRGGRGRDGAWLTPRLRPHESALAETLGVELGTEGFPFDKHGPAATSPEQWDEAIHWLERETMRYAEAVRNLFPAEPIA